MGKHTAKRGEGSMYQNKDGYYTFKVYYIDIDNKKKRKGFSGWDPDETRMRAKEFLRDIEDMRNGVERMATIPQILKRRYELGKVITDADVLDRVLMSEETKLGIRKECDVSPKHFQVIMARFRKNGVVKDNKIFLPLIPTITGEGVGLMVYFSFDDEQRIKLGH